MPLSGDGGKQKSLSALAEGKTQLPPAQHQPHLLLAAVFQGAAIGHPEALGLNSLEKHCT